MANLTGLDRPSSGLKWSPITPEFGAQLHDIEISAAIPAEAALALRDLWLERGLLLFRGQKIDDAAQVRLSEVFGPVPVHAASDTHVAKQRELITISYSPDRADETLAYEVDGTILANWQPWHIDTIYTANIEHGGMLRAIEVPPAGADTGFLDRAVAWDRLPSKLQDQALDLRILYHLTPICTKSRFNPGQASLHHAPERILELERRSMREFPVVSHPAVIEHPQTGRRILNIGPLHAIGIEGHEDSAGDAVLHRLVTTMIGGVTPYFHRWQADDIVVWDNWRMLHSAEGTPMHAGRKLCRSGISGDYRHGRIVRMMGEQ